MIKSIRYKYQIIRPLLKSENEYTVNQVQKMFNISRHMVYYWIERKYVNARKKPDNTFLIEITPDSKAPLREK